MDDEGLDGHGNPSSHHLRSPPPPLLPHVILLIPILAILLVEKSTIDGLLQSLPLPHKFHSDDKWTTRKGRWTSRKKKKRVAHHANPRLRPGLGRCSHRTRPMLAPSPKSPPASHHSSWGKFPSKSRNKNNKDRGKRNEPLARSLACRSRLSSSALNASRQTFPPCSPHCEDVATASDEMQARVTHTRTTATRAAAAAVRVWECGSCRLAVRSA